MSYTHTVAEPLTGVNPTNLNTLAAVTFCIYEAIARTEANVMGKILKIQH